jgi:hypothetical protein
VKEIYYIFENENKKKNCSNIKLAANSLSLQQNIPPQLPEWTKLKNHQCFNCPLHSSKVKYCPIAGSIVEVIDFFQASASYEKITMKVESKNRNYVKDTTIQRGMSSMLGMFLVSSGCPVLTKLKPVVKFHLPFADYINFTVAENMLNEIDDLCEDIE